MRKQPVTAHSTKYPNSAAEQKSSCPVKHGDSKKPVGNSQPKQVVKPVISNLFVEQTARYIKN